MNNGRPSDNFSRVVSSHMRSIYNPSDGDFIITLDENSDEETNKITENKITENKIIKNKTEKKKEKED